MSVDLTDLNYWTQPYPATKEHAELIREHLRTHAPTPAQAPKPVAQPAKAVQTEEDQWSPAYQFDNWLPDFSSVQVAVAEASQPKLKRMHMPAWAAVQAGSPTPDPSEGILRSVTACVTRTWPDRSALD